MITIKNTLRAISLSFKAMTDSIKFKSITVASLDAQVEDSKHSMNVVNSSIFSLKQAQLDTLYTNALSATKMSNKIRKDLGKDGSKVLNSLARGLNSRAKRLGASPFGAIQYTGKIMMKCMRDIQDSTDKIVGAQKGIVVGKTRLSQGIFLGVLEAGKMYTRFNSYLLATISHVNSGTTDRMPKYMINYLVTNLDSYLALTNSLCQVSGKWSVINDITNIKSSGLDLQLYVDEKNNASLRSGMITDVLGIENVFVTLFNVALTPIALIGEVYVDARHQHYMDINEHKKWMETHVANLQLQLSDTDPNDPEYVQAEKAIAYYNDKIAVMEKKVDEYYDN